MAEMKKIRIDEFYTMKQQRQKIAMITCYDYTTAKILAKSQIDAVLVGDSAGMVCAGYANTLPVTLEEMIYHTAGVVRGCSGKLVIADMPFLSYQQSDIHAVESAGRLIKFGGADAVKLEGGRDFESCIRAIVRASIPVCGHIGMTPQSINIFGGFRLQGKEESAALRIIEDAKRVEEAGAFMMVLEKVPAQLGLRVSQAVRIPVIGIGAGAGCDGQVLVIDDILGMDEDFSPKYVKKYANLSSEIGQAVNAYTDEVRGGVFPSDEQSYGDR